MNINFLFRWVRYLIFNPIKLWETIHSEDPPVSQIRNNILLPVTALIIVSGFIGSLLFINNELLPVYSVLVSLRLFLVIIITVYFSALILREVTYPLDLGRSYSTAFRLIVFSATPFFLCQILSRMFESLLFINILGLWGLYIFWTGAGRLISPPGYKKMPLLVAAVIVFAVIYIVTSLALNMITDRLYFGFIA